MTNREIEDRELARWKAANPWRLLNVGSIGTECGRHPTQEAAYAAVRREYRTEPLGVEGHDVLFRSPVYL